MEAFLFITSNRDDSQKSTNGDSMSTRTSTAKVMLLATTMMPILRSQDRPAPPTGFKVQVQNNTGVFVAPPTELRIKTDGVAQKEPARPKGVVTSRLVPVMPLSGMLEFPDTKIGKASHAIQVTLRNSGPDIITVKDITLAQAETPSFSYSGVVIPTTLGPKGELMISVTFRPAKDAYTNINTYCTLRVTSTAENRSMGIVIMGRAIARHHYVDLRWDNKKRPGAIGFRLYRSEDGTAFKPITPLIRIDAAQEKAAAQVPGKFQYAFKDKRVKRGRKYTYRLSYVDSKGHNLNGDSKDNMNLATAKIPSK
jgi:hypothetical protein